MPDVEGVFRRARHLVARLDARRTTDSRRRTGRRRHRPPRGRCSHRRRSGRGGPTAPRRSPRATAPPCLSSCASVVEGRGLDDKARRAETALQGVERHERLLHRMQRICADALDGGDRPSGDGSRRRQAADDRHAVEQHRACAADAGAADELRAGERKIVAQDVGQKRIWIVWQVGWTAVDGDVLICDLQSL